MQYPVLGCSGSTTRSPSKPIPRYYGDRNILPRKVPPRLNALHPHALHPHTYNNTALLVGRQPCWWGGERPVSKSGEALLATGGALLEDPLGLHHHHHSRCNFFQPGNRLAYIRKYIDFEFSSNQLENGKYNLIGLYRIAIHVKCVNFTKIDNACPNES